MWFYNFCFVVLYFKYVSYDKPYAERYDIQSNCYFPLKYLFHTVFKSRLWEIIGHNNTQSIRQGINEIVVVRNSFPHISVGHRMHKALYAASRTTQSCYQFYGTFRPKPISSRTETIKHQSDCQS